MKRNLKVKLVTGLVMFLTTSFIVTGAIQAAELMLAGSTTFQKRILEPTAAAIEKATNIKVNVRGINSGKGLEELRDGKIPASLTSNPLKSMLKQAGLPDDGSYQEHVIIQDAIVPIVNLSNPVSELTWNQLAEINTGKINNWKELGGPDLGIIVITSQPTAATRLVFQEIVMKGAPYVQNIREVRSTREEVDLVAQFKGGIGAVSEGFVKLNPGKVKVIKSAEISRPLSILTKGNPSPEVKAVIDFLRTPEAQKLFK